MIQVASSTLRWPFFLVGAVLVARAVESQKAGLVLSLAATNATGNIVVGTVHGGSIAKVDGTAWGYSAGAVMAIAGGNMAILAGSAIVRNAGALHATRENPTRAPTDAVVISASVARLVGRRVPFVSRKAAGEAEVAAAVGIGSVAAAWLVVHTVFTVPYARLHYLNGSSGIDFNQDDEQPTHGDFPYLAFTIGMTHQVSDTDLKARTIRGTALRQALVSFVLGAVILETTINLVAGLSSVSS
jgi:uncharacterized membrane protein